MTHHPCPYSEELVPVICQVARAHFPNISWWIDPFAGRDGVRLLSESVGTSVTVLGIEIEEEWANEGRNTTCGDSAAMRWSDIQRFATSLKPGYSGDRPMWREAIVVTSPAYGGRFADQYLGTPEEQRLRAETGKMPRRRSYAISLNRRLTEGSGAALQWGPAYRQLHLDIMLNWVEWGVAGAVINISDHYRDHELQPVTRWWIEAMTNLAGFDLLDDRAVRTSRFKDGANRDARAEVEHVLVFGGPR